MSEKAVKKLIQDAVKNLTFFGYTSIQYYEEQVADRVNRYLIGKRPSDQKAIGLCIFDFEDMEVHYLVPISTLGSTVIHMG